MSHSVKLVPISQQSIDEHTTKFKGCSSVKQYIKLKSDSHLPKKIPLFASMKALQKWWKMLFNFILKALFVLKIFRFF